MAHRFRIAHDPPTTSQKPVSRAFADHDPDREGFLQACAFARTDLLSMTQVESYSSLVLGLRAMRGSPEPRFDT